MGYVHKAEIFMASLFYLTGTEYSLAVCIYEYADYEPGMKGMLTTYTVLFLYACRIELREYILVDVTFMIFR